MFESEVLTTAKLNKIKQDTILKNFWKNNDRFADLFNTFLFNGEEILKPDDLTEVDTDVSSMLKFNGHAETVQKILDVVKKKETLLLRMNFLSKFRKTDRLHGMVTLCIYYGEKEWDGPLSLVDMLDIPDKLKFIFSDYKFNLIQMRSCNNFTFS